MDLSFLKDLPDEGTIREAVEFARLGHESISQKRKYTGEPYIVHPVSVLRILVDHGDTFSPELIASPLHDLIEDVWPKTGRFGQNDIIHDFGYEVAGIVTELTDVFTKEAYPGLNRAARKTFEARRIATISDAALRVKLADLIDNTADIYVNDRKFALEAYLPEKTEILRLIADRVAKSDSYSMKRLFETASGLII